MALFSPQFGITLIFPFRDQIRHLQANNSYARPAPQPMAIPETPYRASGRQKPTNDHYGYAQDDRHEEQSHQYGYQSFDRLGIFVCFLHPRCVFLSIYYSMQQSRYRANDDARPASHSMILGGYQEKEGYSPPDDNHTK
jgi:hypothetical protein